MGMIVDEIVEEVQENESDKDVAVVAKPAPKRKTQAQRNKAARL
jgi:BioD-like phosphotransacetylase family protein